MKLTPSGEISGLVRRDRLFLLGVFLLFLLGKGVVPRAWMPAALLVYTLAAGWLCYDLIRLHRQAEPGTLSPWAIYPPIVASALFFLALLMRIL
jgi:hypothetical protein